MTTTRPAASGRIQEARSTTAAPAEPAALEMGDDPSTGEGLRLTTRNVERGGEPWIPVMGEYQFSRDLPENWERELRKIRSGGVDVVATYVIWIIHEEHRGDVRWDAHRDLRTFVRLADQVGLKVVLRVGPWVHGETRNGGFPDWVQALPLQHRSNVPEYLALARGWYTEIEAQVSGLFHSPENPGGPIIGVQVDNEVYDNSEHLAELRTIAESVGIRASLWTATGWGGAQLPAGRVLPLYAGYSDAFWDESDVVWPSFGPMHFAYSTVRDDLSVGMDLRADMAKVAAMTASASQDPWPFATCELGGGAQAAYHRRPVVDPADVSALALVKLGSGSSWQGYYLYRGAIQVQGELTSTQESHSTGYPNDLPVRDYDFGAPISLQGVQREHYHRLRQQHLFIHQYGARLAPHPAIIPEVGTDDVRWSLRGDGEASFLFINNHQPAFAPLPARHDAQFRVLFDDTTVTVPSAPIDVPEGFHAVWPLRQSFGSVSRATVTAQPITEMQTGTGTVVLFAASEGVPIELQLEGVDPADVGGAVVTRVGDVVVARPQTEPGFECEIRVGDTTFVFLDATTARSVWRGDVSGRDTVVVWDGSGWFADGFTLVLPEASGRIATIPELAPNSAVTARGGAGRFNLYEVAGNAPSVEIAVTAPERVLAPVVTGGSLDRFSAPTDDVFAPLESVDVPVPDVAFDGTEQLLLRVDWVGDVVRAYVGDRLVADQFWFGGPFELNLTPYRKQIAEGGLTLKMLAIDPQTGVFVDPRVRPVGADPVLRIDRARLVPVRTLDLA